MREFQAAGFSAEPLLGLTSTGLQRATSMLCPEKEAESGNGSGLYLLAAELDSPRMRAHIREVCPKLIRRFFNKLASFKRPLKGFRKSLRDRWSI